MVPVLDSTTTTLEPQRSGVEELSTVSVVIPCYNEEHFIGKALDQLAGQFESEHYEIIVVDGLSDDGTRGVIENFRANRPDVAVLLVDNPARNIPTALNLGIAAARGSVIARMDAHAVPSDGYIQRCVEVLRSHSDGVVGMPCRVRPGAGTIVARAIAAAVSHPFGIGDAKYRLGKSGPTQESVDTVAFGCFRKSLWTELGGFNEELLTNEDYDFNYRVRLSGRKVILDRTSHCDYFARSTLRALAEQYWRYGSWKATMIKIHPRSIRLRHLAAPAFLISTLMLGVLGIFWRPIWWLLLFELVTYLVSALAAGMQAARERSSGMDVALVMPVVFATIHITWGLGFLMRLLTPLKGVRKSSNSVL